MELLISILVAAILGIQIAEESVLALRLRIFLRMTPYSKQLQVLSKMKSWWALLPKFWFFLILPLIIIVILLINVHRFLSQVFECAICTSTHIGFWLLYLYAGMGLMEALIYAPLSVLFVYVLNIIRRLGN